MSKSKFELSHAEYASIGELLNSIFDASTDLQSKMWNRILALEQRVKDLESATK